MTQRPHDKAVNPIGRSGVFANQSFLAAAGLPWSFAIKNQIAETSHAPTLPDHDLAPSCSCCNRLRFQFFNRTIRCPACIFADDAICR